MDFATTATPDEMKEIFTVENIRMLSKKGEKHGTVTPRIDDRANFEVRKLSRQHSEGVSLRTFLPSSRSIEIFVAGYFLLFHFKNCSLRTFQVHAHLNVKY